MLISCASYMTPRMRQNGAVITSPQRASGSGDNLLVGATSSAELSRIFTSQLLTAPCATFILFCL
jgi:hypothetical protein